MRFILIFLFILSCGPNNGPISIETSEDLLRKKEAREQARLDELERQKKEFLRKKSNAWKKIVADAQTSYGDISSIIKRKCSDCHDETKKLPIYGRVFPRINPVFKHQKHGLEALDFSRVFPLRTSDGYKPADDKGRKSINTDLQLSFLKAFRNSVTERTMPLPSYTIIYRSKRLFNSDETQILAWIDPLIEKITDYQKTYEQEPQELSVKAKAKRIISMKCIRCHGAGISRGGFGDIEKLDQLIKTKYVDLNRPEKSVLLESVESGYMPTNPMERLTSEEIGYIKNWLIEESKLQNNTDT